MEPAMFLFARVTGCRRVCLLQHACDGHAWKRNPQGHGLRPRPAGVRGGLRSNGR